MNNSQPAKSKLRFVLPLIIPIIIGIAFVIFFTILIPPLLIFLPALFIIGLIIAVSIDLMLVTNCIINCIAMKDKKKTSYNYGKSARTSFGILLFALTAFIAIFIIVAIVNSRVHGGGDIVIAYVPIIWVCVITVPISLLTGIINFILYRKANNMEKKNEF